jgi:thiamine-monophosphate kinase
MPAGPLTTVGIGDDAAVVAAPSGSVVAAVDQVIEGRHFRPEWSSAYDVGVKAAARSLADVAAMGAVNTALLVAFAAPGTLPASWATALADGLAAEATRAGAGVVGGDTARADTVTISVTALGDLEGRQPVCRSGARPGDVLAVAGPLGRSAAGLALLATGIVPASAGSTGRDGTSGQSPERDDSAPITPAALVAAHLRPAPAYDAGPEAARLGATALIDVSDGLLADVGHVAAASGVRVDIRSAALPAAALAVAAAAVSAAVSPGSPVSPAGPPADPAAGPSAGQPAGVAAPAAMALDWVLTGGEDHALVAAFPPAVRLPGRWRVIGEVRSGEGVTVDGVRYSGQGGWQHFR